MLLMNKEQPLYEQLYHQLQASIRRGHFQPGHPLPSERQLAAEHGISRPTVRRAIWLLIQKGYVQSQQGRGNVVIKHK